MDYALFTIYDTATGQIKRTGMVPSFDLDSQTEAGESLLEGTRGDPATQEVTIVEGEPTLTDL